MHMPEYGWPQDAYQEAFTIAAEAHKGQLLPGSDLPYLLHISLVCVEVMAALLNEREHDRDLAVSCALLHDVLEDTKIPRRELKKRFGPDVAKGVQALTKNSSLPRDRRLTDSLRRIRKCPTEVWMVKLADRITNLMPPPPHWDKSKIREYLDEARQIHAALKDASPRLAARLLARIEQYAAYAR